jgi:hypothetical protein
MCWTLNAFDQSVNWQALRARFVLDHWPVFSPFVEEHNQHLDGPLASSLIALEQEGH